jgi:hypothetical protein
METSTTMMRELNQQTAEIGSIVGTMNVIVERTNLLSLKCRDRSRPHGRCRTGICGRG